MDTSAEKWNYLCSLQRNLNGKAEQEVQDEWEDIFHEIFGYSRLKNFQQSFSIKNIIGVKNNGLY